MFVMVSVYYSPTYIFIVRFFNNQFYIITKNALMVTNHNNSLRKLTVMVALSFPMGLVTVHVYVPLSLILKLLMI